VASGNYGVIMQWTNLLFNVATITSVVISPIILIKYSQRDYGQLRTFLNKSIRLQGVFISLITALVFVFSEEILIVWLDSTYASLAPAMKVAVAHIAFTQAIRPIYALNTAYNKVQGVGKATVIAGLAHLVTAFVLIKFFGYGIMATILSGAVYCLLLNVIYLPAYASKYLNQRKRILYKCLIPSIACFVVVCFVGEAFKSYLVADSWISLILAGGVTAIVSLLIVFYVILNYEERKMLTSFISKG
jgi:membrane protein EpsK